VATGTYNGYDRGFVVQHELVVIGSLGGTTAQLGFDMSIKG
jgi:hypothetical protein